MYVPLTENTICVTFLHLQHHVHDHDAQPPAGGKTSSDPDSPGDRPDPRSQKLCSRRSAPAPCSAWLPSPTSSGKRKGGLQVENRAVIDSRVTGPWPRSQVGSDSVDISPHASLPGSTKPGFWHHTSPVPWLLCQGAFSLLLARTWRTPYVPQNSNT